MKRKSISRWFSGGFVEDSDRGFGISDRSGRLAWEPRPSKLETEATQLLQKRRRGAQPGQNNRRGVVNVKTRETLNYIAWLFGAGHSIRRIARVTGLARMTVQRHIREMGLRPGYCRCGEIGTHQGWCTYRLALSEARQLFISKWASRNKGEQCEL